MSSEFIKTLISVTPSIKDALNSALKTKKGLTIPEINTLLLAEIIKQNNTYLELLNSHCIELHEIRVAMVIKKLI